MTGLIVFVRNLSPGLPVGPVVAAPVSITSPFQNSRPPSAVSSPWFTLSVET